MLEPINRIAIGCQGALLKR